MAISKKTFILKFSAVIRNCWRLNQTELENNISENHSSFQHATSNDNRNPFDWKKSFEWVAFFYFEKKPECLWQILAKSVRSGKAETKIGAKKFSFLLEGSDFYLSVEKILGGWRSLQVNIGVSCHLEKKNKKTEKGEEEKTSRLEIDKIFVTKSLDNFSTKF